METTIVRMGELAAGHNPSILETHGVGSCVVIVLYDKKNRIGGMAHAMLPDSPPHNKETKNKSRYTEIAIAQLIHSMEKIGASKDQLTARLVGGAQMFSLYQSAGGSIGERNIASAKKTLKLLDIPIANQDTGGTTGRSVTFDCTTGICSIQTCM